MALNEGKKINHNNLFREMLTEHTAKTKGFFRKMFEWSRFVGL